MTQASIKGFIYYRKAKWSGDEEFSFYSSDLTDCDSFRDYVIVCEHELVFDIPDDFNPIPLQVAALEKEKLKLQAEFAKKMMEIEDSISKLTCISMDEVQE